MGNCGAAFDVWKERRAEVKRVKIDSVLQRMNDGIAEQTKRFNDKEKEYEGKIRGIQLQIDKVKMAAKGKLTPEVRGLVMKLMRRRKLYEKEAERYAQRQLDAEAAKTRLEGMRTNAGLLKQHDQLVSGMKELAGLGLDVKGIEGKLDSAEDVMEEINEFNFAFAREPTETALSAEEQTELDAELEREFATGTSMHDISLSSNAPRFKPLVQQEDEQDEAEAKLAAMVMQEI